MTVALVISEDWSPASLVSWAELIARSRREDLVLFRMQRRTGQPEASRIDEMNELDDDLRAAVETVLSADLRWSKHAAGKPSDHEELSKPRSLSVWKLQHTDVASALLERLAAMSEINMIVMPRRHSDRKRETVRELTSRMLRDARCEVVQLRPASTGFPNDVQNILAAISGGPNTATALTLASSLAAAADAQVTALFVAPNVDATAEFVALRNAERLVRRALRAHTDRVTPQATLDSNTARGIRRRLSAENCELVVLGASYWGVVQRFLFSGVSEQLIADEEGPAVIVVRPAIPFANRIGRLLASGVEAIVPQLDRQQRIQLVERVQSSSRWDFDFIALICLSTMIATLGLIQNSVAVVIGAMLVAPLMNPLLGFGLSLVQGNEQLAGNTARTILRGFCIAFAIALLVGFANPNLPTSEMLARGAPSLIDLLVAYISGVAAAYAMGRPNLFSALPGVAIAAALVPPIATAGLCTSMAQWPTAIGALLLFLTNIVAIVLGAASSLWLVGVRGAHAHGHFATWAPRAATAMLMLALCLGVYEAAPHSWNATQLSGALQKRVVAERDAELISAKANRRGARLFVDIVLGSAAPPSARLFEDLESLVHEQLGEDVVIRIETRSVRRLAPKPRGSDVP